MGMRKTWALQLQRITGMLQVITAGLQGLAENQYCLLPSLGITGSSQQEPATLLLQPVLPLSSFCSLSREKALAPLGCVIAVIKAL